MEATAPTPPPCPCQPSVLMGLLPRPVVRLPVSSCCCLPLVGSVRFTAGRVQQKGSPEASSGSLYVCFLSTLQNLPMFLDNSVRGFRDPEQEERRMRSIFLGVETRVFNFSHHIFHPQKFYYSTLLFAPMFPFYFFKTSITIGFSRLLLLLLPLPTHGSLFPDLEISCSLP